MKKVMVVGGGGREHTLVWAIFRSSGVDKVYCVPGNAGTGEQGENVDLPVKPPFSKLLAFARDQGVDLTVVGPEQPLVDGIADAFAAEGLMVFGPGAACARLEGSKSFAKEVMEAAGVPTGRAARFSESQAAIRYLRSQTPPIVVKADGLAAGKGVTVAMDAAQAESAVRAAMEDRVFGDSGTHVLIEEFLVGEEASILALVDGERFVCLPSSQDHKRALDGDQGPNTGGMGAYSPAPVITPQVQEQIEKEVIAPTVGEMARRGSPYRGVLYAGLMITAEGPKVVEFNCRFGDPESQAVLPRLRSDLVKLMEACIRGSLPEAPLDIDPRPAVCVVAASGGYPGSYEKGKVIRGLDAVRGEDGIVVFHAGTRSEAGKTLTAGGRVLGLTAMAANLAEAAERAYAALERIDFEGIHYRKDIAHRALARGV